MKIYTYYGIKLDPSTAMKGIQKYYNREYSVESDNITDKQLDINLLTGIYYGLPGGLLLQGGKRGALTKFFEDSKLMANKAIIGAIIASSVKSHSVYYNAGSFGWSRAYGQTIDNIYVVYPDTTAKDFRAEFLVNGVGRLGSILETSEIEHYFTVIKDALSSSFKDNSYDKISYSALKLTDLIDITNTYLDKVLSPENTHRISVPHDLEKLLTKWAAVSTDRSTFITDSQFMELFQSFPGRSGVYSPRVVQNPKLPATERAYGEEKHFSLQGYEDRLHSVGLASLLLSKEGYIFCTKTASDRLDINSLVNSRGVISKAQVPTLLSKLKTNLRNIKVSNKAFETAFIATDEGTASYKRLTFNLEPPLPPLVNFILAYPETTRTLPGLAAINRILTQSDKVRGFTTLKRKKDKLDNIVTRFQDIYRKIEPSIMAFWKETMSNRKTFVLIDHFDSVSPSMAHKSRYLSPQLHHKLVPDKYYFFEDEFMHRLKDLDEVKHIPVNRLESKSSILRICMAVFIRARINPDSYSNRLLKLRYWNSIANLVVDNTFLSCIIPRYSMGYEVKEGLSNCRMGTLHISLSSPELATFKTTPNMHLPPKDTKTDGFIDLDSDLEDLLW